uniref:Uncharacterized protein n=1 Tax=Anguilla anguilla TaxID=7936 RepID=A0A0E9TBA2_ANGAN
MIVQEQTNLWKHFISEYSNILVFAVLYEHRYLWLLCALSLP